MKNKKEGGTTERERLSLSYVSIFQQADPLNAGAAALSFRATLKKKRGERPSGLPCSAFEDKAALQRLSDLGCNLCNLDFPFFVSGKYSC